MMNYSVEMNFPENLSAFIFDLDGVIWRGQTPIDGAVEAVNALRAAGKTCLYCTNNSRLAQAQFGERLRAIGLQLEDADVMNSSAAAAFYLQSQFENGFTVFAIGEEGMKTELARVGATVLTDAAAEARAEAEVVVVGIDRFFTYDKLRLAQRFILNGARFIATNPDSTFPTENGLVPGAGSLVAAVQTASGKSPLVIGKPQPTMVRLCLERFNLDPDTTVMIGDRLDTDIACGHRGGIRSILVNTGVHNAADAAAASGDEKPDAIYDDLPALYRAVMGDKATTTGSASGN